MEDDDDLEQDDDSEGRIEALLGPDTEKHSRSLQIWRRHLLNKLELPIRVTGMEDFPWEEPYVFGGGDQNEYLELKKTRPSYSDVFELQEINEAPSDEDLIAVVKRVSDGKKFEVELSWLETCERGSESYTILNDYAEWQCNY